MLKAVVETHPNPDVRSYHLRERVSDAVIEMFSCALPDYNQDDLTKLGKKGEELVRWLASIDGVAEITISPYSVNITRAKAYSWSELEPLYLTSELPNPNRVAVAGVWPQKKNVLYKTWAKAKAFFRNSWKSIASFFVRYFRKDVEATND